MRKLILGLIFAACALGQGSNTIFQHVFTATTGTGSGVVATSGALQNIGQGTHLLQAIYQPGAPVGCVAPVNVQVQGSFDNSNWSTVGSSITSFAQSTVYNLGSTIVFGAYPFLRVVIENPPTGGTLCLTDVWYTGTLFPISLPTSSGAIFTNMKTTGSRQFSSAATTSIINANPTQGRIAIYGLWVLNEGATATPVSIIDYSDACVTPSVTVAGANSTGLPAGAQITWPISQIPYFVAGGLGHQVCFTMTGTNPVDVAVWYRLE